jgi:hypothetical protein
MGNKSVVQNYKKREQELGYAQLYAQQLSKVVLKWIL